MRIVQSGMKVDMAKRSRKTASDQATKKELVTTANLEILVHSAGVQPDDTRRRGRYEAREERAEEEEDDEPPLVRKNQKKGKATPSK